MMLTCANCETEFAPTATRWRDSYCSWECWAWATQPLGSPPEMDATLAELDIRERGDG